MKALLGGPTISPLRHACPPLNTHEEEVCAGWLLILVWVMLTASHIETYKAIRLQHTQNSLSTQRGGLGASPHRLRVVVADEEYATSPSPHMLQLALLLSCFKGTTKTMYGFASFKRWPCQSNKHANLDTSRNKLITINKTFASLPSNGTDTKLWSWLVLVKATASLCAYKTSYSCGSNLRWCYLLPVIRQIRNACGM